MYVTVKEPRILLWGSNYDVTWYISKTNFSPSEAIIFSLYAYIAQKEQTNQLFLFFQVSSKATPTTQIVRNIQRETNLPI